MPSYDFQCAGCRYTNGTPYIFTVVQGMNDERVAVCDVCESPTRLRSFYAPPIHHGLTANEKAAGTTKQRFESGKYMKDQREKRKKKYGSGTREGDSNELWTGNEVKDGIIPGPKTG